MDKKNYYSDGKCTAACFDQQINCTCYRPPLCEYQRLCLHHDLDCERCYSQEAKQSAIHDEVA